MDIFLKCLSFILIALAVNGIRAYVLKHGSASDNTVTLHKVTRIIGIVGILFFLILMVAAMLTGGELWACGVFLLFALLGTALIFASVNWRITYDDAGFTFRNALGREQRYTYQEVTGIRGRQNTLTLYIGKRKIHFDEMSVGKFGFMAHVRQQYRRLHNGEDIPMKR